MRQEMKFRVDSVEHSIEIQQALFAAGYKWSANGDTVSNTVADYLYAYSTGDIMYSRNDDDGDYFKNHGHTEYVLLLGQFVKKSETGSVHPQKPPIGLRPRSVVAAHRMMEILEAMHRYVKESKQIPAEWMEELNDLNEGVKV